MDRVSHRATRLSQRCGVVVHGVPPRYSGSVPRQNPGLNSADSEIPAAYWSIRNSYHGNRNGVFPVAVRQVLRSQTVVLVLCNNFCPDRAGSLLLPRVFAISGVQGHTGWERISAYSVGVLAGAVSTALVRQWLERAQHRVNSGPLAQFGQQGIGRVLICLGRV